MVLTTYIYSPSASTVSTGAGAMNTGNGLFAAGAYKVTWKDAAGDGPNDGQIYLETRATGSSGSWTAISTPARNWNGYSAPVQFVTVPAGDEMRVRYACLAPSWFGPPDCSTTETTVEIEAAVVGPDLPAITGTLLLVHLTVHLQVQNLQQHPMLFQQVKKLKSVDLWKHWLCYKRSLLPYCGTSGWSTHWDICSTYCRSRL